jgi:hypothetical protein
MASPDGLKDRATAADPAPFVVARPCTACQGGSAVHDRACAACRGTGVGQFFHGTKADLQPGSLIQPGHRANFGKLDRATTYVYFTGTLDAAIWGAELALGDGRGRIYVVEPTGHLEDDPNLTDQRYPGNPTRSYRSRDPLRVTAEVTDWQGHAPEVVSAMQESLEQLARSGVEPLDD